MNYTVNYKNKRNPNRKFKKNLRVNYDCSSIRINGLKDIRIET
jgi:hypothetical protein